MNLNIFRLGPLVKELRAIRIELTRLADLYELHLQQQENLTTRVTVASKHDLADTMVEETDPDFAEVLAQAEQDARRPLTDEETAKIHEAMRGL